MDSDQPDLKLSEAEAQLGQNHLPVENSHQVSEIVQGQPYDQQGQIEVHAAQMQPQLHSQEMHAHQQAQEAQQLHHTEHAGQDELNQQPDGLQAGQDLHQDEAQLAGDGVQQIGDNQLVGVPMNLAPLQSGDELQLEGQTDQRTGKFKPIDLDRLTPKSRQRVLRNRQAATRSKAKKKAQYTLLKEKKAALEAEVEALEAQHAATQQRIQQLHFENKALIDSYKPEKADQE